jgi:hypothetical protein
VLRRNVRLVFISPVRRSDFVDPNPTSPTRQQGATLLATNGDILHCDVRRPIKIL